VSSSATINVNSTSNLMPNWSSNSDTFCNRTPFSLEAWLAAASNSNPLAIFNSAGLQATLPKFLSHSSSAYASYLLSSSQASNRLISNSSLNSISADSLLYPNLNRGLINHEWNSSFNDPINLSLNGVEAKAIRLNTAKLMKENKNVQVVTSISS